MIFQYNNIPSALLPIIKERIESCSDYFPGWCERVVVEYNTPATPDYELTCSSEYNYRFIVLTVSEEFFRQDNWRESVLHEIAHAIAAPFTTQSWLAVEALTEDSVIRKYLENQLRLAEEAFATDLSSFIDKVLDK